MKSVTEFQSFKLLKAIDTKTALAAEGKTPEEIAQSIGESFKLEGDKLKLFVNAIEVAAANTDKLARVLVVTFSEGESVPQKAVKVEEHHYIPEFQMAARAPVMEKAAKGGGQSKGKKAGGAKSSPWGMSPEEKEAKKNASVAKAKADAAAKN